MDLFYEKHVMGDYGEKDKMGWKSMLLEKR
jgi:hypothetical protein